ncbi:hypothetical protein ACQKND_05380 [Viridibacillus arvi]|uniref:hypothetical protein n=1 Tax=Viridibacillus arvi TaxID=263475 RepID=UPI003CFD9263
MIKLLNLSVWVVICFSLLILIYITYALVNKKHLNNITLEVATFLFTLILIIPFYSPVHLSLYDPKQLTVKIVKNGQNYDISDITLKNEIKEIIERQNLIKSTSKTIVGTPPYPSKQGINIHISGTDVSFSMLVFIRIDSIQYSYIEYDGQYFSINRIEKFVQDVVNVTNQVNL